MPRRPRTRRKATARTVLAVAIPLGVIALAGFAMAAFLGPDTETPARIAAPIPPPDELVYVWSPSMPLSEKGIPGIERTAATLGLRLRVVQAEELVAVAGESLGRSLVAAGATVHYPTVTLVRDDAAVGHALAGFKEAEAWTALLRERLGAPNGGPAVPHAAPTDPTGSASDLEILWSHSVSPPPGAFFRRVPGTSLITYDQTRRVFIHDVVSGEQFRGPGWIDFVPSPDGRLFVTPLDRNAGLEFYHAPEVLERALAGAGERVRARHVDEEMNDQYPSVGILEEDPDGQRIRYRILVSWFRGLAYRDYEVTWNDRGDPSIRPLTPKREACANLDLSIPILSKDGREVAARHDASGTTRVFRLADNGRCAEVLDLGVQTSKVGFSDDGMRIAYSSPTGNGVEGRTWVLDRASGETIAVDPSTSQGLVIPEMVGPDSVLIAVREPGTRGTSEFRLLCCVR